jgi:hypothetical protein
LIRPRRCSRRCRSPLQAHAPPAACGPSGRTWSGWGIFLGFHSGFFLKMHGVALLSRRKDGDGGSEAAAARAGRKERRRRRRRCDWGRGGAGAGIGLGFHCRAALLYWRGEKERMAKIPSKTRSDGRFLI